VTIDNLSDPLATIVEISFGDLLGELLDTVRGGGVQPALPHSLAARPCLTRPPPRATSPARRCRR